MSDGEHTMQEVLCMKRVIALVLCIVCMAGVALGDASSYMGGVWLCDEFDWAGIAIIRGRDIYTD